MVPSRYRAEYFPRTPPFIDEKSYSGRMSFRLFFFIEPSFMACCSSGADNPNCFTLFGMRDDQDSFAVISLSESPYVGEVGKFAGRTPVR